MRLRDLIRPTPINKRDARYYKRAIAMFVSLLLFWLCARIFIFAKFRVISFEPTYIPLVAIFAIVYHYRKLAERRIQRHTRAVRGIRNAGRAIIRRRKLGVRCSIFGSSQAPHAPSPALRGAGNLPLRRPAGLAAGRPSSPRPGSLRHFLNIINFMPQRPCDTHTFKSKRTGKATPSRQI
jgi:hypothetical protein